MSSSYKDKLERARSHVVASDAWTSGKIEASNHTLKVVYLDKDDPSKPHLIALTRDTLSVELQQMADTCDPATFGRDDEDVMDESYRKAGKMDKTAFVPFFDLNEARILPRVANALFEGQEAERPIYAELYKLNIYGEGSFFKSHVDTPRSEEMWGSLVVVYPTAHTGGSLALRHKDKEFIFDAGALNVNELAYVAFFSDVEHEVLPVTQGYRITLTYNLYYTESIISSDSDVTGLKNALSDLLAEPTFLPLGGILGFGFAFAYPVQKRSNQLEKYTVQLRLKGKDQTIRLACNALNLPAWIRAVVKTSPEWYRSPWGRRNQTRTLDVMVRHLPDYTHSRIEGSLGEFLTDPRRGGQFIHEFGKDPPVVDFGPYSRRGQPKSWEVAWISPLTEHAPYQTSYTAYGNEARADHFYANFCLMAYVGPAGNREDAAAYMGVLTREPRDMRMSSSETANSEDTG